MGHGNQDSGGCIIFRNHHFGMVDKRYTPQNHGFCTIMVICRDGWGVRYLCRFMDITSLFAIVQSSLVIIPCCERLSRVISCRWPLSSWYIPFIPLYCWIFSPVVVASYPCCWLPFPLTPEISSRGPDDASASPTSPLRKCLNPVEFRSLPRFFMHSAWTALGQSKSMAESQELGLPSDWSFAGTAMVGGTHNPTIIWHDAIALLVRVNSLCERPLFLSWCNTQ